MCVCVRVCVCVWCVCVLCVRVCVCVCVFVCIYVCVFVKRDGERRKFSLHADKTIDDICLRMNLVIYLIKI